MRQQTLGHVHQPVPFPVPPDYPIDRPVDMKKASLAVARHYYREHGCQAAYERWNELSLAAFKTARTLEEVAVVYFNAPEGSEACRLIFKRFDELSLERVEATIEAPALIHLHRQLGICLAPGGQAEERLNSMLAKRAGWK